MAPKSHWVYGIHAVNALLKQRPQDILNIYLQSHHTGLDGLLKKIQALGLKQHHKANLNSFLKLENIAHQGIVVEVRPKQLLNEQDLKRQLDQSTESPPCYIILDKITDPQNVGAILRTAEAANMNGVIMLNHHAPPMNATVHKTSSGAIEFVRIFRVSNLARILRLLQHHGISSIAMTLEKNNLEASPIMNFFDLNLEPAIAIVLGNEGSGLGLLNLKLCDHQASLPMLGVSQSLNVASTASIAMYEVLRQRQRFKPG